MSASRLSELLVELEGAFARAGCPVETGLAPGRDPDDVRRALAGRGMEPGEDLLTWFSWHDGLADPPSPEQRPRTLVVTEFYSLDQSLEMWEFVDKGDEPWEWPATWLPIGGRGRFNIAVACEPPGGPQSTVIAVHAEEAPRRGPDSPNVVLGIDTMVELWIEAIASGRRRYRIETGIWEDDPSVPFPRGRFGAGLV